MDILDQAIEFATLKHSGQVRKIAGTPYILHPLEVCAIVGTMTKDKEVLAASLLHDTVEDTNTTLEEIREKFGKRVALLVMTETEEKREHLPPESTWELRKEESLMILENTRDLHVKMMWLGDKLSNMRSFAREYMRRGDGLWSCFHQQDPKKQAWYYETIAKCLRDLREYPAYKEYIALVNYVFKDHLGGTLDENGIKQ